MDTEGWNFLSKGGNKMSQRLCAGAYEGPLNVFAICEDVPPGQEALLRLDTK